MKRLAVLAVLVLAGCGGGSSQSLPTGSPAVDEQQVRYEALVAKWAQAKGLEPIPVTFLPDVQAAFSLPAPVTGTVPCGERRIVFDTGMIHRETYEWFHEWITAHEVGHVFYHDYEVHGLSCFVDERRADAFANELTGQDWWPHGGQP